MDPETEWSGQGRTRGEVAAWTSQRGKSPRLYPAALIWCLRKPGRDLKERVETWLAWKRVEHEIAAGTLGGEFEKAEKAEVASKARDAEDTARDEVWAAYRYVVLADQKEPDGLKVIDLGAGHASAAETLTGRIITALKSQGLLNDSVGAGYIERNWPPALKDAGAWPLSGLRQSFLNGALTRLLDPDAVLRGKIPEFVGRGDFGLASGQRPDGSYNRVWWSELLAPDEISFEGDVFLLTKTRAKALKAALEPAAIGTGTGETTIIERETETGAKEEEKKPEGPVGPATRTLRVSGPIPPEVWNRLGTRLIPKLKSGSDLQLLFTAKLTVDAATAASLKKELEQALADLGLSDRLDVDIE
jgi:hypothetical protein